VKLDEVEFDPDGPDQVTLGPEPDPGVEAVPLSLGIHQPHSVSPLEMISLVSLQNSPSTITADPEN
jgi:hypothetical protein